MTTEEILTELWELYEYHGVKYDLLYPNEMMNLIDHARTLGVCKKPGYHKDKQKFPSYRLDIIVDDHNCYKIADIPIKYLHLEFVKPSGLYRALYKIKIGLASSDDRFRIGDLKYCSEYNYIQEQLLPSIKKMRPNEHFGDVIDRRIIDILQKPIGRLKNQDLYVRDKIIDYLCEQLKVKR